MGSVAEVIHQGRHSVVVVGGVDFGAAVTAGRECGAGAGLLVLQLDVGFAAVADIGPVVLAAWGADASAWAWRLIAAPPTAAIEALTESA